MKKLLFILRPAALIGIGLLLAIVSAALSQPVSTASSLSAEAAFAAQTTATAPVTDSSQIGSTDGIMLMSVLIVLIIVVPILVRRKNWS